MAGGRFLNTGLSTTSQPLPRARTSHVAHSPQCTFSSTSSVIAHPKHPCPPLPLITLLAHPHPHKSCHPSLSLMYGPSILPTLTSTHSLTSSSYSEAPHSYQSLRFSSFFCFSFFCLSLFNLPSHFLSFFSRPLLTPFSLPSRHSLLSLPGFLIPLFLAVRNIESFRIYFLWFQGLTFMGYAVRDVRLLF